MLAGRSSIDGRRWVTSTTGDDNTGHIAAEPGEGILFFDNVFPLRIGNVLAWRPWRTEADYTGQDISKLLERFNKDTGSTQAAPVPSSSWLSSLSISGASVIDPVGLVQRALPDELGLTVTEIVPRLKDGGIFVKFRQPAGATLEEIEERLATLLAAHPVRPWFNPLWGCMRGGLVRGVPWLEDLASRVPSSRMRVEFCNVSDATGSADLELSQEVIYSLFRRYGKIAEITSQPFDSKTLPRYATIDFLRLRDAVMARSCLHGFVVNGWTRLRISYEPRLRSHNIWNWITSHPRIVIPIVAALLATITVAVFDPIRTFFIRAHVQRSFALRDSEIWKWVQRRTSAFVTFARNSYDAAADNMGIGAGGRGARGAGHRGQDALMTDRGDLIESIRGWMLETDDSFIVVQGPRGSGKSQLVIDQALHGRRDVLVVDCKPIVEARGESATIKKLATAIGYRPIFSWANSLSSLIDLAVQGTTGVKSGFSETLNEQLSKILQTATTALREVGLSGRHKTDVDTHLNDDAYLEAHPERRPVIVLDNFGHRNEDDGGLVFDKLAEWAAILVQANIAHVVFLTPDSSYPKALVKALPDRLFHEIALGDLSPKVAMNYVLSHLAEMADDEQPTQTAPDANLPTPESDAAAAARESAASAAVALPDLFKAKALESEAKQQSILEKISSPFQRKKPEDTEGAAAASALNRTATDSLTPADTQEPPTDPARLNMVAAKAALAFAGGASGAAGSLSLPPEYREVIQELDGCIGVLGGRLTDLESLVRRLGSGQKPRHAVSEIIEHSASEVIKMFLLASFKSAAGGAGGSSGTSSSASASAGAAASSSSAGRSWTAEQAWYLVREIAKAGGSVCYNDVLLADVFASAAPPTATASSSPTAAASGGVAAIDALAAAELVTVRSFRGRPQSIKPGSPVKLAAFQFLGSDTALAARLDRCVLAEQVAVEAKTVAKVEQELAVLATLTHQPAQARARIAYLLNKMQVSQARIQSYEMEMAVLKKTMSERKWTED